MGVEGPGGGGGGGGLGEGEPFTPLASKEEENGGGGAREHRWCLGEGRPAGAMSDHRTAALLFPPCLQGVEATSHPYGTFTHDHITIGRGAVVGGLCVLAGPGASLPAGTVLPPNSSSTDPEALRRGLAIRPEALRLAERPMGVLPALATLLVVVLFESLMLVPATGECRVIMTHVCIFLTMRLVAGFNLHLEKQYCGINMS